MSMLIFSHLSCSWLDAIYRDWIGFKTLMEKTRMSLTSLSLLSAYNQSLARPVSSLVVIFYSLSYGTLNIHNIVLTANTSSTLSNICEIFKSPFKLLQSKAVTENVDDAKKESSVCTYFFPSTFFLFFYASYSWLLKWIRCPNLYLLPIIMNSIVVIPKFPLSIFVSNTWLQLLHRYEETILLNI